MKECKKNINKNSNTSSKNQKNEWLNNEKLAPIYYGKDGKKSIDVATIKECIQAVFRDMPTPTDILKKLGKSNPMLTLLSSHEIVMIHKDHYKLDPNMIIKLAGALKNPLNQANLVPREVKQLETALLKAQKGTMDHDTVVVLAGAVNNLKQGDGKHNLLPSEVKQLETDLQALQHQAEPSPSQPAPAIPLEQKLIEIAHTQANKFALSQDINLLGKLAEKAEKVDLNAKVDTTSYASTILSMINSKKNKNNVLLTKPKIAIDKIADHFKKSNGMAIALHHHSLFQKHDAAIEEAISNKSTIRSPLSTTPRKPGEF